jgi:hypothetical protein
MDECVDVTDDGMGIAGWAALNQETGTRFASISRVKSRERAAHTRVQ